MDSLFKLHGLIKPFEGLGIGEVPFVTAAASSAVAAANRAYYQPLIIQSPVVVTHISLYVGAAVAGNVDVGIYSFDGRKIVSSGAVDTSGYTINTINTISVIPNRLGPGRYYCAVSGSSGTFTLFRISSGSTDIHNFIGEFIQASAHPLPAAATFATATVQNSQLMYVHTSGATI